MLAGACSVVVDADELQQGCAEGRKPCEIEPGELCADQRHNQAERQDDNGKGDLPRSFPGQALKETEDPRRSPPQTETAGRRPISRWAIS